MTLTEFVQARVIEDERPDTSYALALVLSLHPEAVSHRLKPGALWACDEMMRRLAEPFADHPDYNGSWRP